MRAIARPYRKPDWQWDRERADFGPEEAVRRS